MTKPKRFGAVHCPHGVVEWKVRAREGLPDRNNVNVSGRFCRNCCARYRAGTCSRWRK